MAGKRNNETDEEYDLRIKQMSLRNQAKKTRSVEIRTWWYEHQDEEDGVEKELFIDGKSVLRGNYYDDKIDDRIEGYLQALRDNRFILQETIETKQQIV